MSETRKLKLKSVGDPGFPHLIQVIDVESNQPLSQVVRLDVSFRAGEPLAPGTMHCYKTDGNGQPVLENGDAVVEQEAIDVVGIV
jgi:hypothetical protein